MQRESDRFKVTFTIDSNLSSIYNISITNRQR